MPRQQSSLLSRSEVMARHETAAIRRAWGEWLESLPWGHFVTLTFKYDTSSDAAVREFNRWVRRLEQRAQGPLGYFRVIEEGIGGLHHLHVLIGGTQSIGVSSVKASWPNGMSEVVVYKPHGGAARYVSKSLETGDYDLRLPTIWTACTGELSLLHNCCLRKKVCNVKYREGARVQKGSHTHSVSVR